MDKKTLISEMKEHVKTGCFINMTQIASFTGKSPNRLSDILQGLDCLETKKEKKYFIPDVAQRILDIRTS